MKKIFSLCIIAVFFTFTACQNDSQNVLNTNSKSTTPTQASAPIDENGDILIRIAVDDKEYLPLELRTAMEAFNGMDNGYHIETVIYSKSVMGTDSTGGLQTADMRLQMDILQGGNVDIVMDNSFSEMSRYDILAEKGAFIDLYPFLDGDSDVSRTELNEHILEIHENDGKLYQMPLYFWIETMSGRAEYVGTKENWTLDDLKKHWEKMPDEAFFCNNSSQWYVYRDIIRGNLGSFVDYEKGTCHFDSSEFVELLEFCKQFPETKGKQDPTSNTIYFLKYAYLGGFDAFHRQVFDGYNIFAGYPSNDGKGSIVNTLRKRYSICASAHPEVQQGAWEFICYMLSEDVQAGHNTLYGKEMEEGFPINNAAFERMAEEQLVHTGETRNYDGRQIGYLTQDEYEQLLSLISSLARMESPVDNTAQTIIENEIEALFLGEQTAEEVAKAIQGRMEIMISERM